MNNYFFRKIFSFLILATLVGMVFLPHMQTEEQHKKDIIIVDDEGDGDFTSIQDALNFSSSGDTIEVYSGTYEGRITIDHQIFIHGIDREFEKGDDTGAPVLTSSTYVGLLILVEADDCEISGFYINPGIPEGDEFGNNGIALHSKNNRVFNNVLQTGNRGIIAYVGRDTADCSNNSIYNNSVSGFSVAIQIEGDHCLVKNDEIFNNTYGIHIFDADDVYVTTNNFIDNFMHAFIFWIPFSYNIYYSRPKNVTFDKNYYDDWIFSFPKPILRGFAPLLIPILFSITFDWHPAQEPYEYDFPVTHIS